MPENWSDCIRQYRLRHGMTQSEFGALLGVSQRTVSRWERGEDQPNVERQKQLRDLGWKPVGLLVRNLALSVRHCPAPRALSHTRQLRLLEVSGPAIAKRPTITDWIGRSMREIATGVLAEILDDCEVQKALHKQEISGILTTTGSVLDTGDCTNFGLFHTTISYFFHDGEMYSDAISVPAPDGAACGYQPIFRDELVPGSQI